MSRAGGMTTRLALQIAVFGAFGALVGACISPFTTALAVISPVAYAALASLWLFVPMIARIWSGRLGSAVLAGAVTGLIDMSFSRLGVLLPLSLILPMIVFEAVMQRQRTPRIGRQLLAAVGAGATIAVVSIPVIDPSVLGVGLVVGVIVVRIVSCAALVLAASAIARRLRSAGLRG